MRLPELRYSKAALLVFGAGLALGFVVVVVRLPDLGRVASIAMTLGIIALPAAIYADSRRGLRNLTVGKRRRRPANGKRRATPQRRRRAPRRN